MDPSTPSVQDVQNQTPSNDDQQSDPTQQQVNTVSSDDTTQQKPSDQASKQQPKHQQISVGSVEAGAVVEEDDNDDDDEELLVAPQETKGRAVLGQNEGDDEDESLTQVSGPQSATDIQENVEIKPSGPEASVSASPEVEKVIEKTADQEKPIIPKEVEDMVTHSGPGVIVVEEQNKFGVSQMPISPQQATTEFKTTKLHDSRHWFVAKIMYIWMKLQPKQEKRSGLATNTTETNKEEKAVMAQ